MPLPSMLEASGGKARSSKGGALEGARARDAHASVVSRVSRRASTSDGRVRAHPSFGWGRAWIRRSRSRRASARSSVDGAGRSAGAAGSARRRLASWRLAWVSFPAAGRSAGSEAAPWKSMWRFTASARLPLADWSARLACASPAPVTDRNSSTSASVNGGGGGGLLPPPRLFGGIGGGRRRDCLPGVGERRGADPERAVSIG